ncbi:hypothetical protein NEOLEDRAFT_1245922 [Neolentinus lepideus HHB14362 ss-1]|uniref:Fungal-type protein kinase domain-containing protein n=1 Tax=Neolentinus lepideus HHB14362 ss-1 TaxID=1314782 RepID=A0A165N8X1_9AGAM|nr:hypothetical protein NEOLEDRAFT_1245922 [Neolentinus lepideus HHB14362 ss-1]
MPHVHKAYATALKSKPGIALMRYGPSFSKEQVIPRPPRYTHMAAPIEVKREAISNWQRHRWQLAVYVHECLVQQRNRILVYGALLTEQRIQLFQFDRAGVLFSVWVDIHAKPATFIKIILGLSTTDEKELGFETCLYWYGSLQYFKPDLIEPKAYVIHDPYKLFRRHTIRGRGTTCWILQDDDASKLVLKLSWWTRDREAEWRFLEDIKAENERCKKNRQEEKVKEEENKPVPGIGSIIAHKELESLSSLRHGIPLFGPPLEQAPSALQSLRAFRDITVNMNYTSSRGFLIDFDMAKRTNKMVTTDLRTGTRAFQSIKVLDGLGFHDYLDDLESSFWAYTWIACTSKSPVSTKKNYLNDPDEYLYEARGMGRQIFRMLLKLGKFFHDTSLPRNKRLKAQRQSEEDREMLEYATEDSGQQSSTPSRSQLDEEGRKHFTEVLSIVDGAITRQEDDVRTGKANILVESNHATPVFAVTVHQDERDPRSDQQEKADQPSLTCDLKGTDARFSSSGSKRTERPSEGTLARRSREGKKAQEPLRSSITAVLHLPFPMLQPLPHFTSPWRLFHAVNPEGKVKISIVCRGGGLYVLVLVVLLAYLRIPALMQGEALWILRVIAPVARECADKQIWRRASHGYLIMYTSAGSGHMDVWNFLSAASTEDSRWILVSNVPVRGH